MRLFNLRPISALVSALLMSGCAMIPSKTQMPDTVSSDQTKRTQQLEKYGGHLGHQGE